MLWSGILIDNFDKNVWNMFSHPPWSCPGHVWEQQNIDALSSSRARPLLTLLHFSLLIAQFCT